MNQLSERIRALECALKEKISRKSVRISDITYLQCDYKTNNDLPPRSEMKRLEGFWGGKRDTHYWFAFDVEVEKISDLFAEIEVSTGKEGWDLTNPQFLVYLDGKIVQGMDTNHTRFDVSAGMHSVYLYAYTGTNVDDPLSLGVRLIYSDPKAESLYYDLKAAFAGVELLDKNTKEYTDALVAINSAYTNIDFLSPDDKIFAESVADAGKYINDKFYGQFADTGVRLDCIGQTHLDIAWLWSIRQAKEKAQRSFATALSLIDKYPDFTFIASQPYLYETVSKEAPELYERIKNGVKNLRLEAEGGMYVQADCNIPSGESLIRQIAFGKRYFKEELGVDSEVLWLPDSFGFPASLPQILKKTGIKSLVTNKLSWNDTNEMPYDVFMWRGIDSSEVFTCFLTAKSKLTKERYTTCNADATPDFFVGTYERFKQKELTDEILFTYGYGDGGGGPTKEFIENIRRAAKGIPGVPKTIHKTLKNSLAEIKKKAVASEVLPIWKGELYFEFHRGVYTSIAFNKKNNRKSEILLHNAELWSSIAEKLLKREYPSAELKELWKKLLVNQFHDILPGTCVAEALDDSDRDYAEIFEKGENLLAASVEELAKASGSENVVFNSNGFNADGYVCIDGKYKLVKGVGAFGFGKAEFIGKENGVTVGKNHIENGFVKVSFGEDGFICGIYDKRANREILKAPAELLLYEDRPLFFDSAELREWYKVKSYKPHKVSISDFTEGERAGKTVVYEIGNSRIMQKICLYGDSARIDFDTEVDWREKRFVLRAIFPLDINAEYATGDVQFGNVRRSTATNTSWERAKFEYCAHKYVDVSEGNYGVAVLNDCKYGYSSDGNVIGLTLLRCHQLSAEYKDNGIHNFSYAFYPHDCAFASSDVVRQAYLFNNPMFCLKGGANKGDAAAYSDVTCDNDNVMIETLKKADDGSGYIIRLYETSNCRSECRLTFARHAKKVYLCDMLENIERTLSGEKASEVIFTIKPYEILTLKVLY